MLIAAPPRSPGDCTRRPHTPTIRWLSDRYASSAVIRVIGTTRTVRLTSPLRSRSTPLITEYFRNVPLCRGNDHDQDEQRDVHPPRAPPRKVTTRNGTAERKVRAVSITR